MVKKITNKEQIHLSYCVTEVMTKYSLSSTKSLTRKVRLTDQQLSAGSLPPLNPNRGEEAFVAAAGSTGTAGSTATAGSRPPAPPARRSS